MVRTLPFRSTPRPDPARVLAIVTAIALHLLALLLLLIPMASYRPDAAPVPTRTEPWVQRVEILPPPEPPEIVPLVQPRTLPATQPRHSPVIPQTPAPSVIETTIGEYLLPATETGIDAGIPAGNGMDTGTAVPMTVSSLSYVHAPAPLYPRDALRTGAQGTVLLKVLVDTDGLPLEVTLEKSSGHRSLDREAISQVRQHWRFQPALHEGSRVRAYGMVPIVFSLQ